MPILRLWRWLSTSPSKGWFEDQRLHFGEHSILCWRHIFRVLQILHRYQCLHAHETKTEQCTANKLSGDSALGVELMDTVAILLLVLSTEMFFIWTEELDLTPYSKNSTWEILGLRLQSKVLGWYLKKKNVAVLTEFILRQESQSKLRLRRGKVSAQHILEKKSCFVSFSQSLDWIVLEQSRMNMYFPTSLDLTAFVGQLRF